MHDGRAPVLSLAERDALLHDRTVHWRRTYLTILVSFVLGVLPAAIYLPGAGHLDHVLGRSVATSAEIVSVVEDGGCGRRNRSTERRVTVRWTDGATTKTGSYTVCGRRPTTGSTVTVWLSPGDHLHRNSPGYDRTGLSLFSLFAAGVPLALGLWLSRSHQRRREALLSMHDQGHGFVLHAPTSLEKRGRGAATVTLLPPVGAPGLHGTITPFVTTRPDGTVKVAASMGLPARGQRYAYLLPAHRPRHHFLLLDDQRGRTWLELTTKA